MNKDPKEAAGQRKNLLGSFFRSRGRSGRTREPPGGGLEPHGGRVAGRGDRRE